MKALIAMSGGVDSSVTAHLVKNMGYTCLGATMKLISCKEADNIRDAEAVAEKLSMPFYVLDFREEFKEKVINKFVSSYEKGFTPNPCIDCNRHLKFKRFYEKATELGCHKVATGHYAVVEKEGDRFLLKKAKNPEKDQSYVLYSLGQEELSRTLFPLGSLTKAETRMIAEEQGFINAKKGDSQDICFVPDGDYVSVIEGYTGKTYPEGDFVDKEGRVLGRHKGIIGYTIGQRKGLGLALPAPMYVCEKDAETNRVVLCSNEELFSKSFFVGDLNWIAFDNPPESFRAKVKVRYRQNEQSATVKTEGDMVQVIFDEPQRAVAKGQAAVFYDGDTVLGGGTILGSI